MIPDFNDDGYLPPGIHLATLEEVVHRFGNGSEVRRAQGQSLGWLAPLCREAGIARLIVNGSFVTDIPEPNDVDCLLLPGVGYNQESQSAFELEDGLPFLSIDVLELAAFERMATEYYASEQRQSQRRD